MMLDRGAHLSERFIVVHVDLFVLERAHEALGFGVVIRIAGAAHADLDFVVVQHRDVISRGILHAPIRMMDQPSVNGARVQRYLQSRESQLRVDVARDGPTNTTATKGIEQDRQVNELTQQANVSDISYPELIDI